MKIDRLRIRFITGAIFLVFVSIMVFIFLPKTNENFSENNVNNSTKENSKVYELIENIEKYKNENETLDDFKYRNNI